MVECKRSLILCLASILMEWSILQTVPAVIMTTSPDVSHFYTVVAIAFQVAIEELVGIKLHVVTISLDCIDTNQCLRISSRVSLQFEEINLTVGTRILGIEGYGVSLQACSATQYINGSRIPGIRSILIITTVAGKLSSKAILQLAWYIVDTHILIIACTSNSQLHGLISQRQDADIHILGLLHITDIVSRYQRSNAQLHGLVFLINGIGSLGILECSLSTIGTSHILMNLNGTILIEGHSTLAVLGITTYCPRVACEISSPAPNITYNRLIIGYSSPTVIITIEVRWTIKFIMRTIQTEVDFPSLTNQLSLVKLHILSYRNRTDSQCLINRSGSTACRILVEAICHGKSVVGGIDRTREIVTVQALARNIALSTGTGCRQEDRVTIRTGKLVTGYMILGILYPFFLTLCEELLKLIDGWHGNP